MTMTVAALWRYPVKTLAGEPIQSAELTHDGMPGAGLNERRAVRRDARR